MLLQEYPNILGKTSYYLIKTKNGAYYEDYKTKNRVGLYQIHTMTTLTKKKEKELLFFKDDLKKEDVIVIPGRLNKMVLIGKICSDFYIEESRVYKKVFWLKEISTTHLPQLYKYLHLDCQIKQLQVEDFCVIERLMYSIFSKAEEFHFIFHVTQKEEILCQSLYGLVDLILNGQPKEALKIKIALQSPGIIEFITENHEIITTILKVIHLIYLLTTKNSYTKKEDQFLKEQQQLIKKYHEYQVSSLSLQLPKIKKD